MNPLKLRSGEGESPGRPQLVLTVHGVPAAWADRFWSKVPQHDGDGCWEWQGTGRDQDGYGVFWLNGKTVRAPRAAWLLTHHEIPAGLIIRHSCDNPPCVNPAHLLLGTHADNNDDRVARDRSATGDRNGARTHIEKLRGENAAGYRPDSCRNNHPLDRRYISPSGERICTDCTTERRRRYRAKARAGGRRVS